MAISKVLQNFRGGDKKETSPDEGAAEGPRIFKLTDDEAKSLAGDGAEKEYIVTGRVGGDGDFTVVSVRSSEEPDDEENMASQVMGMLGRAPVMQSQTMPSPS